MARYNCIFCDYKTDYRNNIHCHHIIPRELNGTDDDYNLVYLCPNHHGQVYIENTKTGIHSIPMKNAIVIIGWVLSTNGYMLSYRFLNDSNIQYIYKK